MIRNLSASLPRGPEQLKALLEKENVSVAEATWITRLPQAEQGSRGYVTLNGESRNFITFEGNTVLPKDGKGMVHMASFNFAYRLSPVCDWLFEQSK